MAAYGDNAMWFLKKPSYLLVPPRVPAVGAGVKILSHGTGCSIIVTSLLIGLVSIVDASDKGCNALSSREAALVSNKDSEQAYLGCGGKHFKEYQSTS